MKQQEFFCCYYKQISCSNNFKAIMILSWRTTSNYWFKWS